MYQQYIQLDNIIKNAPLIFIFRSVHFSKQYFIITKEPRLLLTLVLVFLSDVHFHGEAACEEVVGVRLTLVWWRWR